MKKKAATKREDSILAATKYLKMRGKPAKAAQINSWLKKKGLAVLTSGDLVNNFDKKEIQGDRKNKYGYSARAAKKTVAPAPKAKKAVTKQAPKAKKAKKACSCNKACNAKTASKPSCRLPEGCAAVGSVITAPGFSIARHNQFVMLENALYRCEAAVKDPSAYVFLAGAGDWPAKYKGIEIISRGEAAGLLLTPRPEMNA